MKSHWGSLFLFCLARLSSAQFDTLWIGTLDGPSTTLVNTPFPTGTSMAARSQYLVRSSALVQAGLNTAQPVLGICLQVVDQDLTDPPCLVDLHVLVKNEGGMALSDLVQTGLQSVGNSTAVNLSEGILGLPFTISPWMWLGGGSNMLIEINHERSADAGLSPRIMLDTGLNYSATFAGRTEQAVLGSSITSFSPADVQTGSDNSLPILGLVVAAAVGLDEHGLTDGLSVHPNPVIDLLHINAPMDTRTIVITDIAGRTRSEQRYEGGTIRMDTRTLQAGVYTVTALDGSGHRSHQRLVKP